MEDIYNPIHIKTAAENYKAARKARISKQNEPLPLTDEYRKLFHRIAQGGQADAGSWTYALSTQEKLLLCTYVVQEATPQETEVLMITVVEYLDDTLTENMYRFCQNNYDNKQLRDVFALLRSNKKFMAAFEHRYGIKPDGIMGAMMDGNAPEYINSIAGHGGGGSYKSYTDGLDALGISESTRLGAECARLYILVCDAGEYRRIGCRRLTAIAEEFDLDFRRRLLRNMINVMDPYQLRMFIPMLPMFAEMTGAEGSKNWTDTLGGLGPAAIEKYKNWLGQYKIYLVLGSGERADFWLGYGDKYRLSTHGRDTAVIFRFDNFSVIEFKTDDDAAYFYDNAYMDEKVIEGLSQCNNEKELKVWLRDKTEWGSQGECGKHWRKAHRENWQLDMKIYIRDTLARK